MIKLILLIFLQIVSPPTYKPSNGLYGTRSTNNPPNSKSVLNQRKQIYRTPSRPRGYERWSSDSTYFYDGTGPLAYNSTAGWWSSDPTKGAWTLSQGGTVIYSYEMTLSDWQNMWESASYNNRTRQWSWTDPNGYTWTWNGENYSWWGRDQHYENDTPWSNYNPLPLETDDWVIRYMFFLLFLFGIYKYENDNFNVSIKR